MEEMYDIFEYHFVDKESGLGMVVWARTDEVANEIARIDCTESCVEWIPKKRKFKVAKVVNRPPYELEQEQLEQVNLELERRQAKHAKEKGN